MTRATDMPPVTPSGTRSQVVRAEDCATQWGNEGLTVLSTPAILGAMERLCVDLLTPTLQPGQMTVGVDVSMTHSAPVALGDTVTYTVYLIHTGRRIDVEFTVTDSAGTVVSSGRHQRAVISREKFLARLAAQTP